MMNHAFNELLAAHRDRVYSLALYSLRDADDAEDVTQEVFVRLWHRYDGIDPDRVGAWLARVTHNLCVDQARRRRSRRRNFGEPDPEAVAELVAGPQQEGDPTLAVDLDERQRALLEALDTLTPETRGVMLMHYFQGMKLHEIGAALDKSVSALKVQIHRARRSLRLVLAAQGDAAAGIPADARRGIG